MKEDLCPAFTRIGHLIRKKFLSNTTICSKLRDLFTYTRKWMSVVGFSSVFEKKKLYILTMAAKRSAEISM